MKDILTVVAIFLVAVPCLAYLMVLNIQFAKLKEGSYRLQILSTRAASCIPIYAMIIFISFIRPDAYVALNAPIAIFEGYSFYCFIAFVVENLGGPAGAVSRLKSNGKDLCCTCCCPSDRSNFYQRMSSGVFHLLTSRSIITLVSVIFYYSHSEVGKKIYIVLSLIAFALLVNGLIGIVVFYENVMADCENLMGVSKVLVLKVSVGLIVLQGIIVELITAFNSSVNPKESTEIYCKSNLLSRWLLLLISFHLFCFLYSFIHSSVPITRFYCSCGICLGFGCHVCCLFG